MEIFKHCEATFFFMFWGIFHTLQVEKKQIIKGLRSHNMKSHMLIKSTFLQKKAVGSQLLEQVFYHLDIIEKDYFGLQFTDPYNVAHWLDPTKLVKKQVKSKSEYF